jgi:hypothetical protein
MEAFSKLNSTLAHFYIKFGPNRRYSQIYNLNFATDLLYEARFKSNFNLADSHINSTSKIVFYNKSRCPSKITIW